MGDLILVEVLQGLRTPAQSKQVERAGPAVELSTLRVTTDQFSGTKPMDLDVQWQRCNAAGASCSHQ